MGDTVSLTIVSSEGTAEVVCGLLRSEDIACFHRPAHLSAEGGGFGTGAEWRDIIVNEEDLSRARELITTIEPLYAECAECGRPIGDDGRWYPDGTGELLPYCDGCAEREFGPA